MERPIASKNLDVPETSRGQIIEGTKGSAGDLKPDPLLSVVCPREAHGEQQRPAIDLMAASTSP